MADTRWYRGLSEWPVDLLDVYQGATDFANVGALVIGDNVPCLRDLDLADFPVTIYCRGILVASRIRRQTFLQRVAGLDWAVNILSQRGLGFQKGLTITVGAIAHAFGSLVRTQSVLRGRSEAWRNSDNDRMNPSAMFPETRCNNEMNKELTQLKTLLLEYDKLELSGDQKKCIIKLQEIEKYCLDSNIHNISFMVNMYIIWANHSSDTGDWSTALRAIIKSLVIQPNNITAFSKLFTISNKIILCGMINLSFFNKHVVMGCRRLFYNLKIFLPDKPGLLFNLGIQYIHRGQDTSARKCFVRSATWNPSNPRPYEFIARLDFTRHLLQSAKRMTERAVVAHAVAGTTSQDLNLAHRVMSTIEHGQLENSHSERFLYWPETRSFFQQMTLSGEYSGGEKRGETEFIEKTPSIFLFGGSYSRAMKKPLEEFGIETAHFELEETLNSTFSLRGLLEWVVEKNNDFVQGSILEDEIGDRGRTLLVDVIKRMSMVIIGCSTSFAHFNRVTGCFAMPSIRGNRALNSVKAKDIRLTNVFDNVKNYRRIVEIIREINPTIEVILIISPVPLTYTNDFNSVISAESVSKSTLRVAVNEYLTHAPNGVSYWPAYELVSVVSPQVGPIYGTEDDCTRHIGSSFIRKMTINFIENYFKLASPINKQQH